MNSENHESKIDVRIIVSGLDIAQLVSKAVNNIQLDNDYNIIVSSIIPTVELSIVKKVANHLHTNLLHDKKSINTRHKMRRLEYIESLRNDKK